MKRSKLILLVLIVSTQAFASDGGRALPQGKIGFLDIGKLLDSDGGSLKSTKRDAFVEADKVEIDGKIHKGYAVGYVLGSNCYDGEFKDVAEAYLKSAVEKKTKISADLYYRDQALPCIAFHNEKEVFATLLEEKEEVVAVEEVATEEVVDLEREDALVVEEAAVEKVEEAVPSKTKVTEATIE